MTDLGLIQTRLLNFETIIDLWRTDFSVLFENLAGYIKKKG